MDNEPKWWTPTTFTDEEKEMLVERLSPSSSEDSENHFQECPVCGYIKWLSTYAERPYAVKIELMSFLSECPRCSDAQVRNPEMFKMFVGAINRIYRNLYRENP